MPEFHNDSLVPTKHGVLSPFAKLVWGLIALSAIGILSLFILEFDFGRLRGATHFVEQARAAIAQKNWPVALASLQRVPVESRSKVNFLRVLADYLEGTRTDPGLLGSTLESLDTLGQMQPEDFIWLCRVRMTQGRTEDAQTVWERIPEPTRSGSAALVLRIGILTKEGNKVEAKEAEARLYQKFPNHPEVAVRKAVSELEGTFPEIQRAALERLWKLAERDDESGLTAIQVLAKQSELTLQESMQLLQLADKQPLATPDVRLGIVSQVMQLAPKRRETLLKAEIERYKDSSLEIVSALASWLAHEKEYERVLELRPDKILMKSPDLFPMVAQGLAEQRRWTELLKLVQKKTPLPVSNARAATWRALATHFLHPEELSVIRSHLQEAIQEGGSQKDFIALMGVARTSEEWGIADLAFDAYKALAVPGSRQEVEMLDKCWQMASLRKDTVAMTSLARDLCKLRPTNVMFLMRRDYLSLLLGLEIETTIARNEIVVGAAEESDIGILNRALKAFRLHDHDLAVADVRKVQSTQEMAAGLRAVYVGILAMSGEKAKAYELAEKIRPELLLKEELVFLDMAL